MISAFVADASLAMSWVLPSQSAEAANDLLNQVMSGAVITVPSLWLYEVSNSLVTLLRRKRVLKEDYLAARAFLQGLRISVDDAGQQFAGGRTADLALEFGLTVYDAAYLELAMRKQVPLASRDADLNRAATRCGVTVLLL